MKKNKNKAFLRLKTLFKFGLVIIFFGGIVAAGYYFFLFPQTNLGKTAKTAVDNSFGWKFPVAKFPTTGENGKLIAYSNIRDPGGIPQGLPVRLKIPVIGVDSAIEDAQITPDGRMDVPAGSVNVAWFSLGPHPGDNGSAVIGGHFGITNGVPFVFYKLDKVKVGDKVYIVNDKGDTLAFQVQRIQSFDRNADATTVFTSGDGKAHLNLITCEGVWNQVNDTYPQRLVVFTDAIPAEGAVAVKTPAPVVAKPKLPPTAVNKAQTTPIPTPEPTIVPKATSAEEIVVPDIVSSPPQILIASAKSLYTTPLDGMVTSVLLISIIFIGFRIIRR